MHYFGWLNHWRHSFLSGFCYLEQKAAKERTVLGFQKLCRGKPQRKSKAIVSFFSILPAHTSQSPDNLVIMPRHLDKTKGKLSLFFHQQCGEDKKREKGKTQAGVRVKQSHGHLYQDSNRFTKSGDNANSNSSVAAIIACCKIEGSHNDKTALPLKPLIMWRYGAGHTERDIWGPITPKLLKTPKSGGARLQTRGISVEFHSDSPW